jgi:hypothetical protein
MRDTAPLAAVDRARPSFIRPVWSAPRTTTQLAHSLGSFVRDATLAADRQMTHLADVASSLAVASLAASLTRRPSLTRRVSAVRPPTRRVSEGGIGRREPNGNKHQVAESPTRAPQTASQPDRKIACRSPRGFLRRLPAPEVVQKWVWTQFKHSTAQADPFLRARKRYKAPPCGQRR